MTATQYFKENIIEKLENKAVEYSYSYPESFEIVPVGAYRLTSDIDIDIDLQKFTHKQENEFYVSIWGNSPAELEEISNDVCQKAQEAGFTKTFLSDIPRGDEAYYHREIRLKISFNPQQKIVL